MGRVLPARRPGRRGAVGQLWLAAYAGVDQAVLTYLAMRELAGQLPNINSLTITPDLLTGALSGLMAGRGAQ